MLNVVTLFKALVPSAWAFAKAVVSTIGAFFEWKHDEALRQDGANEAELEGRKAVDEIINRTRRNQSDDSMLDTVSEKYYRD